MIFSQISASILLKLSMLPQPVRLLKLTLDVFCRINIQWGELYSNDYIKSTLNTGQLSNTYKPIRFRLSMMLDTAKFHSMVPI